MTKLRNKKNLLLWALLVAVCVLHFLIVQNKFLNFSEVFDGKMIMNFDYGLHYYDVEKGVSFLDGNGSMNGYDTAFFGGFEKGVMDDLSAKLWIVFAWVFSSLGTMTAYKLFVYVALFAMPLIFASALKTLKLRSEIVLLGLAIAVLYQNTLKMGNFLWVGMITFPLAVYLSILCVVCFKKMLAGEQKWRYWIYFTALASLAFYAHILAFILVGVPCLVLYLMNARKVSGKNHSMIFAAASIVVLLNLPWLWPLLSSGIHITNEMSVAFFQSPSLQQAFADTFYLFVVNSFHPFNLRILLLIGAVISLIYLFKKDRKLSLFLLATASFFALLTYLPINALNTIQPYRFQIALDLWSLVAILLAINSVANSKKSSSKIIYSMPLWLSLLICALLSLSFFVQPIQQLLVNQRILNTTPNHALEATIDYFQNIETTGRILFEVEHSADAVLFQTKTNTQLIGGPYRYAFWGNAEANFTEDRIFNMDITQIDEAKWREMIEKYSITYAVCYSQKSCSALLQNKIWYLQQDFGDRKIFSN